MLFFLQLDAPLSSLSNRSSAIKLAAIGVQKDGGGATVFRPPFLLGHFVVLSIFAPSPF